MYEREMAPEFIHSAFPTDFINLCHLLRPSDLLGFDVDQNLFPK